MKPRLITAMACYAGLAVFAAFALDGLFRIALWIFLAGLVIKTLIAAHLHS